MAHRQIAATGWSGGPTIATEPVSSGRSDEVLICPQHALGKTVAIEQRGTAAALHARVLGREVGRERGCPAGGVEWTAERSGYAMERERGDADVGCQHRHVARERFEG